MSVGHELLIDPSVLLLDEPTRCVVSHIRIKLLLGGWLGSWEQGQGREGLRPVLLLDEPTWSVPSEGEELVAFLGLLRLQGGMAEKGGAGS